VLYFGVWGLGGRCSPHSWSYFSAFSKSLSIWCCGAPNIANLQFQTLSVEEGVGLIKPFSLDEIKEVVWDRDSYKSPGPDGINFVFIKEFWPELKDDILRFVSEFHCNGKLSKGINTTFIALIPKVDSLSDLMIFDPSLWWEVCIKLLRNYLLTDCVGWLVLLFRSLSQLLLKIDKFLTVFL